MLRFERAVNKNTEQRSKYPDDPTKYIFFSLQLYTKLTHSRFIDSEADLDLAIKSLLPLSQILSIAYPEFVKSSTLDLLIGLLSHENMDIVIDVVELIHELTDEDANADEEQDETGKAEESLKLLVDNLVRSSGFKAYSH